MKRYNLVHLVALLAVLFASVGQVQAVVLGPFSGTWDGTEPLSDGRLFRDGTPSDGITQKPWPGVLGAGSFYKYEVFQFYNNGPADVVTVNGTFEVDQCSYWKIASKSRTRFQLIPARPKGFWVIGRTGYLATPLSTRRETAHRILVLVAPA